MVKLACMTLPYSRSSFERSLEGISRAGYQYISFGLPHAGVDVPMEDDPKATLQLQRWFDKYDLQPVSIIGTVQFAPGQPLERAKKRLELAKTLGVEEVLSLGTWGYASFPDEPLPEAELHQLNEQFAQKYKAIAAIAEELQVRITLKPHTGNTATAIQLAETLKLIGSKAVKACYDPGNIHYYEGIDSVDDMPYIADELISFIAKDHRGSRAELDFPIPGEGEVNFPALFKQLKQVGFAGPVIVERLDDKVQQFTPEETDERIKQARINLERMLHEASLL